jgi:RNA polymerase sigma-70 factor (ECF subfamily)
VAKALKTEAGNRNCHFFPFKLLSLGKKKGRIEKMLNLAGRAGSVAMDEKTHRLALVDRARKGDTDAFGELVKMYQNYVYNFAYNLTSGHRSEAEDLTQMTFLRAFRAICRFEGRSELKTWLHRITVNLWKNLVRSQKRRKYFKHQSIDQTLDASQAPLILEEKSPGPYEKLEQREASDLVRKAISKLPPDEREVTVLRDLEGYAYEEIARICAIPLGTVKSRLARARRMLKNSLEPVMRSA